MNLKNKIVFFLVFLVLIGIGSNKIVNFQDYNPTVIIQTNKFQNKEDKELLKGDKINAEFKAQNNNLGIISVLFNTHSRINDDYLQFSIKEVDNDKWYYSNKYKVDQFQDYQYFPFGFPEINNSKNKIYQIEIESLNGTEGNSVKAINSVPFLSKYSFPKAYLLQNKNQIPIFVFNKTISFFRNIGLLNYFIILFASLLLVYLLNVVDIKTLTNSFKRFNKVVVKNNNLFLVRIKNSKLTIPVLIMLSILGLFIVNLWLNWPIRLKALAYGDDLTVWNFFNTNRDNFFVYIFSTVANKFRPILNLVFFGLFYLFGSNTWLFGVFNIMFSFLIAVILFLIFRKISKNIIISFCFSTAFILSRFAYYDITQALGLMEAMALLFSALLLYLLWCYLNTEKIKYFWISLVIFTMLIFTHERFITISGVYFVLFLILGLKKKNILLFLLSTTPVILIFILKIFVLQIRALDGTGGTNILQTFNISAFFQFFLSGWFYLFGINAGPTYLNGISSEGVSSNINILIYIEMHCLFLIFIIFGLLLSKSKRILLKEYVKNLILFFSFIFFTLIAASVTFRLEMRWLYVPFVGLLFLFAYVFRVVLKQNIVGKICVFLIILWLSMFFRTEMFYRSYYKNIYYWSSQTFGNALYEATLEKYGDDFWNYKTYIVCAEKTSSLMLGCDEHGDLNSLFKQFEKKGIKANLYLVNKVSEITPITNNSKLLIINYDQQLGKFVDFKVGNELRKGKLMSGWCGWNDGNVSVWAGKEVEALFQTGDKGKMIFEGFLPEYNLPNTVRFFIDDKLVKKLNVNDGNIVFEIKVPKNRIVNLKIITDKVKSPAMVKVGIDVRELGILVTNIKFE